MEERKEKTIMSLTFFAEESPKETEEPTGDNDETEPKGEEGQDKGAQDLSKTLEEVQRKLQESEERNEELEGRLESLQDSLDSALEELSGQGKAPEAEPVEEESSESGEPEGEGKTAEKESGEEEGEEGGEVEEEIEKAIKEDQNFREEILTREELRDLRDEMREIKESGKYPLADEDEVLRGIEDGVHEGEENQVELLFKESHEKWQNMKDKIRKETEEELRAKLKEEQEGGTSIPQSQGTPGTPKEPAGESGAKASEEAVYANDDLAFGEALERAKKDEG